MSTHYTDIHISIDSLKRYLQSGEQRWLILQQRMKSQTVVEGQCCHLHCKRSSHLASLAGVSASSISPAPSGTSLDPKSLFVPSNECTHPAYPSNSTKFLVPTKTQVVSSSTLFKLPRFWEISNKIKYKKTHTYRNRIKATLGNHTLRLIFPRWTLVVLHLIFMD